MLQAMTVYRCRNSSGQRMGEARKVVGITNDQSKEEKVVDLESTKRAKNTPCCFADGHLSAQESGMRTKISGVQRPVVLRGDIVKQKTVSHAVFTEQGSSVSHMTAAKVMGVIGRLPGSGRTSSRRSVGVHPNQNGGRSKIVQHSKVRMSRYLDTSSATQVAQIMA